jgi:hypothetical protein
LFDKLLGLGLAGPSLCCAGDKVGSSCLISLYFYKEIVMVVLTMVAISAIALVIKASCMSRYYYKRY